MLQHGAESDDARPPYRTNACEMASAKWRLLKAANVRWIPRKPLSEEAASEYKKSLSVRSFASNHMCAHHAANTAIVTSQALDEERLIGALECEDLRLLRVEWLLGQPVDYKLQRRQELEKPELADPGPSPLLSGAEVVALIRKGNREVGALSYGWLLPWDPDPTGARMTLLRSALVERPHIKALFWDQATLYQPPRTQDEDKKFGRALHVMMDLYASAIGTTCAACAIAHP